MSEYTMTTLNFFFIDTHWIDVRYTWLRLKISMKRSDKQFHWLIITVNMAEIGVLDTPPPLSSVGAQAMAARLAVKGIPL